jgi:hypothetical protein
MRARLEAMGTPYPHKAFCVSIGAIPMVKSGIRMQATRMGYARIVQTLYAAQANVQRNARA